MLVKGRMATLCCHRQDVHIMLPGRDGQTFLSQGRREASCWYRAGWPHFSAAGQEGSIMLPHDVSMGCTNCDLHNKQMH